MATFFDTMKRSFTDVPVDASKDNAISTSEFLEAAESLTTLFGMSIIPFPPPICIICQETRAMANAKNV
jgi:hypothetical protein